ncbi:SH3 domain-containing protein [Tabrizicola flagellatus]|uniref:SH3 domain-containing protein n=1 Tax=Tabrizicola flagellatus TaxID=2593021 RepID=UPI0011F0DC33|nr:SH3 domain-containing protein [Tabrizicola flagellatus]
MLRLTLILCAGLYAALMIAGEDRGQLRPGLAAAAARMAAADGVSGSESGPSASPAETLTVVSAEPVAKTEPQASAAPVVARAEPRPAAPAPYVEPAREVVTRLEEPIFSLASLGNEAVPAAADAQPAAEAAPEVADGGMGTIWYVVANSVNVRAEPSTEADILGRLGSGEAALLVQQVDADWARIVIQGDGVEGYVAMRYLSPEAP